MVYDSSKPFDLLLNNPNIPVYDDDLEVAQKKIPNSFMQGFLNIPEDVKPGDSESFAHFLGRKGNNVASILANLFPMYQWSKASKAAEEAAKLRTPFPMTKGERTDSAVMMADEARLATERKTAEQVLEFRRTQAKAIKDYTNTMFSRVDSADAGQRAVAAWQKVRNDMQAKHNAIAEAQFKAIDNAAGSKPLFSMRPLYDEYLAQADKANRTATEQGKRLAAYFDKEAQNLLDPVLNSKGETVGFAVKKLSAEEFRNRLHLMGRDLPGEIGLDAKTKGDIYGKAMGILDDAASKAGTNSPIAKAIIDARQGYKERIKAMDEFDSKTLNQWMSHDAKRIETPEAVMERLSKLGPTERQMFNSVAATADPKLIYDLRNYKWQKMVDSATVKGAASKEPDFDIRGFLTNWDKNKGDIMELIPDPAKRAAFEANVEQLRKVANNAPVAAAGDNPAIQGAAAVGGKTAGLPGYLLIRQIARKVFQKGPQKLFDELYDTKPDSFAKAMDSEIAKTLSLVVSGKALGDAISRPEAQQSPSEPSTANLTNNPALGGSSVLSSPAPVAPESPKLLDLSPYLPTVPGMAPPNNEPLLDLEPFLSKSKPGPNPPKIDVPKTEIRPQEALDNIKAIQGEMRINKNNPKVLEILQQELIKNQEAAKGYKEFE